jgi:hypothetical protein
VVLLGSGGVVNPSPNIVCGGRTELLSELENPDAVERSASHQPCGRLELEDSIKQGRIGAGAPIDMLQKTTVVDWGD